MSKPKTSCKIPTIPNFKIFIMQRGSYKGLESPFILKFQLKAWNRILTLSRKISWLFDWRFQQKKKRIMENSKEETLPVYP